ncbi:hypothetical protein Hypma_002298 [Hypsizygus marmoreus]|uniref:Uncharacterized protein n=1 Tax=Hypsizygus marmoreus TaxID=39966 RepID=A0A369K7Z2_HYPMA|nr:hypothetical protein Hypma_002298 [Hypsizygus marmoreus]
MAILFPHRPPAMHPAKRTRRTATSVMAGAFDPRPPRDVLTSLLNGVPPYKAVEKEDEARRTKKKEKRERDKVRKKEKAEAARAQQKALIHEAGFNATPDTSCPSTSVIPPPIHTKGSTSSFWRARPAIHIATMQRSVSVTPPPTSPLLLLSTPASTPGPSNSSSTSRTSSKRPRTPDDYEDLDNHRSTSISSPAQRQRKKRQAVKKGWKGWVEGSPPPSEKLINLDAVPVLQERRTRSGKNFDAIGVGKDGWV